MTWYPTTRKRLRKLEATNSPHYRADTKRVTGKTGHPTAPSGREEAELNAGTTTLGKRALAKVLKALRN